VAVVAALEWALAAAWVAPAEEPAVVLRNAAGPEAACRKAQAALPAVKA
jgi:hypothetical protein